MWSRVPGIAACLVCVLVGCSKDTPGDPKKSDPTVGVAVRDNEFTPNNVTAKVGEDVVWVWEGNGSHGIRFLGSTTNAVSPTGNGYLYVRQFDKPGVYQYICPIHGKTTALSVSGMAGQVTVR